MIDTTHLAEPQHVVNTYPSQSSADKRSPTEVERQFLEILQHSPRTRPLPGDQRLNRAGARPCKHRNLYADGHECLFYFPTITFLLIHYSIFNTKMLK